VKKFAEHKVNFIGTYYSLLISIDFILSLKTVDLGAWKAKILEEMAAKDEDTHVEIGEVIQHVRPILSNIIFTYYLLRFSHYRRRSLM